jgi:hypothetical protein
MNSLLNILWSFLGSSLVIGALLLYAKLAPRLHNLSTIGQVETWFVIGSTWWTNRLVLRNIPGESSLFEVRWHVWLREVIPPSPPGVSPATNLDTDLSTGERLMLPGRGPHGGGEDQTLLSFRIEPSMDGHKLVITDKLGNSNTSYDATKFECIHVQCQFQIRHRPLVKHLVTRWYVVPMNNPIGKPVSEEQLAKLRKPPGLICKDSETGKWYFTGIARIENTQNEYIGKQREGKHRTTLLVQTSEDVSITI